MRRLLAPLLGTLLAGAALVAVPAPSRAAAACPSVMSPAQAAQQADAVFTGVVAGKAKVDRSAKRKTFTYPVTVQTALKGSAAGAVSVISPGGHCGLGRLTGGSTYLFFVTAKGTSWLAPGNLGSTDQGVETLVPQVQAALVPPTVQFGTPMAGSPMSFRRAAAPGAALVIIGLLGLLVVRRFRRA